MKRMDKKLIKKEMVEIFRWNEWMEWKEDLNRGNEWMKWRNEIKEWDERGYIKVIKKYWKLSNVM